MEVIEQKLMYISFIIQANLDQTNEFFDLSFPWKYRLP